MLQIAPGAHTAVLAMLSTSAALAAAAIPLFAGAFSDRARRAGGDRRAQTAAFLTLDAIALIAMAFVGSTAAIGTTLVVAIGALTAAQTVYQVLLPEIVPRAHWGLSAGFRGAMTLGGTIGGLAVAALLAPAAALIVTALFVVASAFTLLFIPAPGGASEAPPHALVRDRRDLGITLIARAWIVLGMSLLNTYVLYFFSDVLHVRDASLGTGLVAAAALVGAVVSSVVAGLLSDRFDRRIVVALSGVPMTAAAFGFALAPTLQLVFLYAALFGLGYGGVFSVGWAIALDAIPELGDVARDLGIWGTLSNLPAVAAPALGAALIAHGATPGEGYRWLFVAAGAAFALGSVTVLAVRQART